MIVLCLMLAGALALSGAEAPPNVVVIFADDMGWGDVGYHGYNAPPPERAPAKIRAR